LEKYSPISKPEMPFLQVTPRIARDAIVIKPAGTAFPKTDRGNVIRAAFIRQFTPYIMAFYKAAEETEADSGKVLSHEEVEALV
jgi:hypothetical protein